MKEGSYQIFKTTEFTDWLDAQTNRSQVQIRDRIEKIESYGHFGDCKSVSEYKILKQKNPTIKTLAKIVHAAYSQAS